MPDIHTTAVKMVAESADTFTVAGYGVVWGGQDISGERFTADTDFWFDRISETPMVLYRHGLDGKMAQTVVGQVCTKTADDYGLWIEAQIKDHETYSDAVRTLVKRGMLGWSSGAVSHLVSKVKKGGVTNLTSWPIAEWSLVPDPCEPRTLGVAELDDMAKAAPAFKSVVEAVKGLQEGSDSAGGALVPEDDKTKRVIAKKPALPMKRPSKRKLATTLFPAGATDQHAAKELPDGPTLLSDDDGGPYPEGSYEDLATDIATALRAQSGAYAYVQATFPGYALVCICSDDEDDLGPMQSTIYRVAYTLDDMGEPVLGEMEEVEPAMIATGKSTGQSLPILQTDEAPLAIQSARLSDYAALLLDRTKGINERRIKEGRVLSTLNRDRLTSTADALEGALKAIRDLLQSTEPEPAKAISVDRMTSLTRELEGLQLWASVALLP